MESLPFDILNTTGVSLCCVDNLDMRKTIEKCGVSEVPTLLTKYFNQIQQQIVGDEIYAWITAVADKMGYKEEPVGTKTMLDVHDGKGPSAAEEEEEPIVPVSSGKGSVLAQALSMQKSRDIQMGDNKKMAMNKT